MLPLIFLFTVIAAQAQSQNTGEFQQTPKPVLNGHEKRIVVSTGAGDRTALLYKPRRMRDPPAILFVLHGVTGTGKRIRMFTSYDFDRVADEKGFAVVYPDAVAGRWNDCRLSTKSSGQERAPDDAAFLRLLAERIESEIGIAGAHRFVAGYSNGGHMALRLAVEHPDDVSGIAVFGANLPASGDLGCEETKRPVAALFISGTEDPVNPYEGGIVRPPVGPPLGEVRSARASAEYFAALTGASQAKTERLPDSTDDGSWLEQLTWNRQGQPDVSLLIVHGGGHTLPNPRPGFPAVVGPTNRDASGAELIWTFFERQIPGNAPASFRKTSEENGHKDNNNAANNH